MMLDCFETCTIIVYFLIQTKNLFSELKNIWGVLFARVAKL